MLAPLLATLLAASNGPTTSTTAQPEVKEKSFDALAVPLVSFNSDDGLGVGAAGGAYFYRPGVTPYAQGIGAQVYLTSHGVQNHFIRYDAPQFLGSNFRVEGKLELRREKRSPYYGIGNLASPGVSNFENDPFYQFDRRTYGGWARARYAPIGWLLGAQPYLGYTFHENKITPNAGSLLEEQQPVGIGGGSTGQLLLGSIWDTRNEEADPSKGGEEELSLRLGGKVTGSDFRYGELTVSERRFFQVGDRVILAGRLLGDYLFGDVPFFELSNLGGISPTDGLGGLSSVRGLPRNRYIGNTKLLLNSEVRYLILERPVFGTPTRLGGVAFADVGRVFAPDVADGPWYHVHPGFGVGLRVVRRAAAVRLDYGVSEDRQSIYVTFGQVF